MPSTLADDIVTLIPRLRGFSRHLCHDRSRADDLVQETILRSLVHADQFEPGTNLYAWLCTILRNCYFNQLRADRKFVSIEAHGCLPVPTMDKPQEASVSINEVEGRMRTLPHRQRQALKLVAIDGYSYEAAAQAVGCAVGTMKSRVARARIEIRSENRGTKALARA